MTAPLVRRAAASDLAAIVALLADDPIGADRENPALPLDPCYTAAFAAIAADPHQLLAIATLGEEPVGTLHLTFIPGLARRGAWRADLKAVRIASAHRGQGLGGQLLAWAVEQSRARGCDLVQLASSATRKDAHRFYERAGFSPSHVGYKLALT